MENSEQLDHRLGKLEPEQRQAAYEKIEAQRQQESMQSFERAQEWREGMEDMDGTYG
jgi:hypothetical protein